MRRNFIAVLAVLLGSVFVSCTATSEFMTQKNDTITPTSSDAATVVFFRHSGYATAKAPVILTADEKYAGEGLPKVKFEVRVPAGQHMFVAWGEGKYSIKANLKAGKTYYVVVAPKIGEWSPLFHHVPVKKGTPDWDKREERDLKKEKPV